MIIFFDICNYLCYKLLSKLSGGMRFLLNIKLFFLLSVFPIFCFQNADYVAVIRGDYRIYVDGKYNGLKSLEYRYNLKKRENTHSTENKFDADVWITSKHIVNNVYLGNTVSANYRTSLLLTDTNKIILDENEKPIFHWLPDLSDVGKDGVSTDVISDDYYFFYDGDDYLKLPAVYKAVYSGMKNYPVDNQIHDSYQFRISITSNVSDLNIIEANHVYNVISEGGEILYIEDKFTEEFIYNSKRIKRTGFILTFFRTVAADDNGERIAAIKKDMENIDGVKIDTNNGTTKLTLENLLFEANSDVLLNGQNDKIDKIISLIKSWDKEILIVGHTASTNNPANEKELSLKRALKISELLTKSGYPPKKIFSEGRGAEYPLVPNDTESNKEKNRRVEIYLLN